MTLYLVLSFWGIAGYRDVLVIRVENWQALEQGQECCVLAFVSFVFRDGA